jgi:hypothetical protein
VQNFGSWSGKSGPVEILYRKTRNFDGTTQDRLTLLEAKVEELSILVKEAIPAKTCMEAKERNMPTGDTYLMTPHNGPQKFKCEQDVNGGGWTKFAAINRAPASRAEPSFAISLRTKNGWIPARGKNGSFPAR